MAIYNLDKYTAADGLGFPLNFRRGNPNPLDNSSVWASLAEAQTYAASDPTAYVGQILTVVDNTAGTATVYSIQNEAGTLKKVGTSPVGDESTITVAEDGTVSLYGVKGLELTRDDGEGNITKINYQPLLVEGKLTWVEPSATTVEGLATEIEGLKTRLSTAEGKITQAEGSITDHGTRLTAIEGKIGEVAQDKTLVEMIADAQTAATYDDTALKGRVKAIEDDYLKTADKTELTTAIATAKQEAITAIMGEAGIDAKYDTLKEIADWILSDTTASADLITRVSKIEADYLKGADKTALEGEIDALSTYVGDIPEGAASATVIAYIQEVVDGLKIGDYAKAADLTALVKRVTTAEGKITALEAVDAEKNVIASVDTAQFNVDENRKLTLLDITMSKVTGLTDALAGKVDKVEGSRLINSDEIAKLGALILGEGGAVEISGKVNASNVEELDTWIGSNRDTVAGLYPAADATKLAGIEAGAQANSIENVTVNGDALAITDKAVNIPLATAEKLGVVKSSAAENKVAVAEDGTMEVNNVNVNKLIQTEGESLILNGGAAN